MIRTLIVDDEAPAREELKYILGKFQGIEIIAEAFHGEQALELNEKLKPDLLFLDIQMPKLNGIDVARRILDSLHRPYIVFVTAYEQYAIEAFEVNAVDYILKPVSEERMEKGMGKIMMNLANERKEYYYKLRNLIDNMNYKAENNLTRICVYEKGRLIPLDTKEIIYATVEDKNTVIVSSKGKFIVNYTLSQLSDKLDKYTFFRSHKSFLINLNMIEVIEPWFNSTFNVTLKGANVKIPVSRSQSKEFKELMNIS